MNANKAQEIINRIVADYRDNDFAGGRKQYAASKKYIQQAEQLGILDMIPNAPYAKHIGNTEIQLILAAATDAPKEVGGMVDGEGDVIEVGGNELYNALNEVEETVELTEGTQVVTVNEQDICIRLQVDNRGDSYAVYIAGVDARLGDADPFGEREVEIRSLSGENSPGQIEAWENGDDLTFTFTTAQIQAAVVEFNDTIDDADYANAENERIDALEEAAWIASNNRQTFNDWMFGNPSVATVQPHELDGYWRQFCELYKIDDVQWQPGSAETFDIERRAEVNQVVTASEADTLLGKAPGTTAQGCRRGKYQSARQSGSTWLIHRDELLDTNNE